MVARAVVVMGVSGCGKSTVAALIARQLGYEMIEGDRLHPPENVAKMRAGFPLEDADRWPWLDRVGEALRERDGVVATCSALKRVYRDRLRRARPDVVFVYLKGPPDLFAARVAARRHEYMPASLLASQFATLEEPGADEAVVVDAAPPPEAEAEAAVAGLETWGQGRPGAQVSEPSQ